MGGSKISSQTKKGNNARGKLVKDKREKISRLHKQYCKSLEVDNCYYQQYIRKTSLARYTVNTPPNV